MELLPDLLRRSGAQTVEDVVVPLLRTLSADPRLLQQVMRHEAAHDGVLEGDGKQGLQPGKQPERRRRRFRTHLLVKVDFHELPEAAAVVVPYGLCVSERLQQRVGCRFRKQPVSVQSPENSPPPPGTGEGPNEDGRLYLPRSSRRCPDPSRTMSSGICREHDMRSSADTGGWGGGGVVLDRPDRRVLTSAQTWCFQSSRLQIPRRR